MSEFKNLVSSVYMSPSIIGNLSDYHAILGRRRQRRGWTLFFLIILFGLQLLYQLAPISVRDTYPYNAPSADRDDKLSKTLTASNLSTGVDDASTTLVNQSDQIAYRLSATNPTKTTLTTNFQLNLSDLLEYSTVIDTGGGTLDHSSSTLSWSNSTMSPGETQYKSFVVKAMKSIPATPRGSIHKTSYDCLAQTWYGSMVTINIQCPNSKYVEALSLSIPDMNDLTANIILGVIILVVLMSYLRTRIMIKEISIIRTDLSTGAI